MMPSNAEAINHMAYTPCHATSRPALLSVRSPPSIRHRCSGLARSCQQRYATPLLRPTDRLSSFRFHPMRHDAMHAVLAVVLEEAESRHLSRNFGATKRQLSRNIAFRYRSKKCRESLYSQRILRRYRVVFYSIIRRTGRPSDTSSSSSFAYLSAPNQRRTRDALVGEIRHLPNDDDGRRRNRRNCKE